MVAKTDQSDGPSSSPPILSRREFVRAGALVGAGAAAAVSAVVIDRTTTTSLKELATRMVEARVHRIIVVDRNRFPLGIVTSLDLVRALALTTS